MISVKLKTLTPVHIGSGRELARDVEFLQHEKKIGVIDEKKILGIIGEENIPIWVALIEKQENLLDYLEKRKRSLKLEDVSKYIMPLFAKQYSKTRMLKEQLRDGLGRPLIPGTSVKGAIRTVLFNILLERTYQNIKNDDITNTSGFISDRQIQKNIFGQDANRDIMRFLKTGDAHFSNKEMIVLSVLSLNYYLNNRTKRDSELLQLTEAIGTNSEATFRMKLDLDLWKKNIDNNEIEAQIPGEMKSFTSLFKALNEFTIRLLESEIKFWERDRHIHVIEEYIDDCLDLLDDCKECKENEAVLRLGHGSGWLFMTGGWVYNPELISDDLYEKIIDKTRPKNFNYKDYFFPKTRRMDEEGELMGFVKLTANI